MKRISTLLALLSFLLLAACSGGTAVSTPESTAQPPAATGGDTAVSAATSFTPAANVDEAAVLRADDHTHGAAEPIVAIIEYGDFQ